MRREIGLCCLVLLALPASSFCDDWGAPEPTSYRCRGFGYVAEVFPPGSRQNDTDRAFCYFYETGYPGKTWEVKAKLIWKGPLVNARDPRQSPWGMPEDAIVSMDCPSPRCLDRKGPELS